MSAQADLGPSPLRRPEFRNLLAISITVALGFGMIVPILPIYARSFGVTLAAIGLVQFVFGTTRFSFGLVGGLVVDRFGERACTIAGLLIVSASSFAIAYADSFAELVLARGSGGAGSALFVAGLMNRVLRIIEPEAMGRATGIWRSSFLVGIGIGPVLGGVVAKRFSLATPFVVYGAGLVLAALIAYVVMGKAQERGEAERRRPLEALRAARPLLSDKRYVIALLATLVSWWAISGPAQAIGSVFAKEELGLSEDRIGLAVTLLSVGEILVLLVAGRAADRYGRRAVLLPSLALTAISIGMLGQVTGQLGYFAVMVAMGAGIAAMSAAAGGLLADAIPREGSGTAVGVNQMAGDVGYLIAPLAIGTVAQTTSFGFGFLVGAVPAALVFVAALGLPGGSPKRSEQHLDVHDPIG